MEKYIVALILGLLALAMFAAPGLFTKATGSARDKAVEQLNYAAAILLAVALLNAMTKFLSS